jgi:hypothetical protein
MEKEAIAAKMDADALSAKDDLNIKAINKSPDPVKEVGNWMKKWYARAGYKRLARILIEVAD